MASPEFFRRLGLLVVPGYLDRSSCAELRRAARDAAATRATVYDGGDTEKLDGDVRQTSRAHVDAAAADFIRTRFAALQSDLERQFKVALTGFREPQFLIYRKGDFFVAHRDASPDDPPTVRIRKVSVVVFLNGESPTGATGSYAGGSLTFYGLVDDPKLKGRGFPVVAEEGLLVAFPADTVHRVSPVTEGERYTVVTWFT